MLDQIQAGFYAPGQVRCFPHSVYMHEIYVRVVPEKMVVQCGHIDSVIEKRRHDGIDFILKQHKIAHHHFASVCCFGQRDPSAESEWRRRRESLNRHLQVVPRDIHFQDPGLEVALPIQRFENILIVARHVLRESNSVENH